MTKLPAGGINRGESPAEAATRETIEETGWTPGPLHHLVTYQPTNGLSDQRFELFLADGASYVGEPSDPAESSKVEWLPHDEVRALLRSGAVTDGLSLAALLWWTAFVDG